ncbi:EscD/YscD/HrpQ family type III secretion system inner membrane ring protein [Pectobacterium punjabense]|uniref:EscD/YscD/HrpQ family type III secretion system inner membrane ring protein n=1 Tax=Pectobacterium punjabense TaxID=2108399 RepID=A0ABX6L2G5_9GAMM|nr:FHA domain-containing protein [Pectobacterium punjabense]MBS4431924.1 EscD/YscD/HrpQ family type III secretion system inner membrane ring protein [Pectobacterium punjabense]PTA63940.1 EscD/YscD/HrpQ family type III secretion system inner membrane ring protein [Pectobacterium punjabense]QJA20525.1 EscD/YscD/HrpQ family type III secretion system inner membrane ring protein [Pectobacterium punjabense]
MFELRVLTGLHRGAALPLCGNAWRIGAADDADLVLYDPGIAPYHGQLEKSADGWALSALDGALCNTEGHAVEHIDALPPGTPFALGQIWLCIVAANTPWLDDNQTPPTAEEDIPAANISTDAPLAHTTAPTTMSTPTPLPAPRLPLWAKASYLLLGALLLVMVGSWQLQESVAMPAAPPPQDTRKPLGTLPQLESTLRMMLQERELSAAVKVAAYQDRLTLTGQLTPDDQKKLERMLAQLHQRYRTALSVDNRTQLKTEQLPFQIVQVTSGSRANVVTADGQRFFIGDEVDNLRLVRIDEHQIEFSGRQQITVNW